MNGMAPFGSLAQPLIPSPRLYFACFQTVLPVSFALPGHHQCQTLPRSPHLVHLTKRTSLSLSALLESKESFLPPEQRKEDLIGEIEVDLTSIGSRLKGANALLEALKLLDLIERLGIQRYFEHHIRNILRATHMQWDQKHGLHDAEATVLAFRLLRLHGYPVSAGVLVAWEDGGKSFLECFSVDSSAKISAMLNLYRCSQTGFPGESEIMKQAEEYARSHLLKVLSEGDPALLKANNLGIEVSFALELPRKCLLPRLESRSIIRQLSPGNESTRNYLELAKLDLQASQKLYQQELEELDRWWSQCGFDAVKCARKRLVQLYFSAAPSIYEPQFASYRLAFVKIVSLITVLDDLFDGKEYDLQELQRVTEAFRRWDSSLIDDLPQHKLLFRNINGLFLEMAAEANRVQGRDVLPLFRRVWMEMATSFLKEAEWIHSQHVPSYEEYIKVALDSIGSTVTSMAMFLLGEKITDEMCCHISSDSRLVYLVAVVARLCNDLVATERELSEGKVASAVGCYTRDHPGCTQEEAAAAVAGLIESACEEMEWELYQSRAVVPEQCSRAVINIARSACFIFKRMDGFTNSDGDYMELFRDFVYHSL